MKVRLGISQMDIAKMLGVTIQAVNNEMQGQRKSKRIREAISKLTKTPIEKLFPEHYQEADRVG